MPPFWLPFWLHFGRFGSLWNVLGAILAPVWRHLTDFFASVFFIDFLVKKRGRGSIVNFGTGPRLPYRPLVYPLPKPLNIYIRRFQDGPYGHSTQCRRHGGGYIYISSCRRQTPPPCLSLRNRFLWFACI